MRQSLVLLSPLFLLCFASTARAQLDPCAPILGSPAPAESVPLPFYDMRLDSDGLPMPAVVESKRQAWTAEQRRARAREIEQLELQIPLVKVEEHELLATPVWVG